MKPGHIGFKRLFFASQYSLQGFKSAWKYEAAFRQEIILTLILTLCSFALPVTNLERVLMIGSLLIVIIVELANSAIEAVVDRIGSEWHELSGRAKDLGSAAVLVSLILVGITWASILVNLV